MMAAKAKQVKLVHMGAEDMDGKSLMKYEMTAVENEADKSTMWIDPATKMAVKVTQVIPAMGNAVMTKVMK